MANTLHVSVTQEDIDNGKPGNPCYCPVASALHRALPSANYVRVTSGKAVTSGHLAKDYREWYLPDEAVLFVMAFDAGQVEVQPFEFDLEERFMP